MANKIKSISKRIHTIANKFNCTYNQIKFIVYSNYGNNLMSEDEKLKILEKLNVNNKN